MEIVNKRLMVLAGLLIMAACSNQPNLTQDRMQDAEAVKTQLPRILNVILPSISLIRLLGSRLQTLRHTRDMNLRISRQLNACLSP